MLDPRQLLRLSRWARRPPSARQVAIFAGVLAAGLLIAGIEKMGWLPDFITDFQRTSPPRVHKLP